MNVQNKSRLTLLQNFLRGNALFSLISGVLFLLFANTLAGLVGIGTGGFTFLGGNLIIFALLLAGLSTDAVLGKTWGLVLAGVVILMDLLWIAGSVMVATLPSMATTQGKLLILGISVIVGTFAIGQSVGLFKILRHRRRRSNLSQATGSSAASWAGVLLWLPLLSGCGPVDIRPASLQVAASSPELLERGRVMVEQLAEVHGYKAWQQYRTQEVRFTDAWQAQSWWPTPKQELLLKSIAGTFTAQATLLDGPHVGEKLGIQNWKSYRQGTDGELTFEPAVEELTVQNFYIPSLQYFNELPFRLLGADLVAYGGERIYRGRTYDLLLATWGSLEPNEQHDQYLLWIDRETGLLAICQYTVREIMMAVTGTIHFEDYREVQGVYFPFKQTVILPAPENTLYPLDDYFFHQSVVSSVSFDTFEPEVLIVDASVAPEDRKSN